MMIKEIFKKVFGIKEKVPPYPNDFAIIDFSQVAKHNGTRDEQNKIIYRYKFDRFGKRIVKKYQYSRQREFALQEVYNIPILDKTEKIESFPVFKKILPSEIEFNSK